ncbi:MAG: hypothetical protein DRP13_03350 [Candidatus Aenigmatarchaeota archaeon]|nr:MAG: hypothetical protein DRP18_00575 [Candidatus Aenigmarchaeota archaeon]RLJ07773.1 MAG: hypothetical protein DRP13_03350 [Candidatus Aenigmarchaeota archaeon]
MNLKTFLKKTFGKDIFTHLKNDEILEERTRVEKRIEQLSDEIKNIQEKIRQLMIESKGQPMALKMLNIQKIKALRLESNTKQQEAQSLIKQEQLLLLLEAMKEHEKLKEKSEFVEKILDYDIEHLNDILFNQDVQKALEEGKIDEVKEKLQHAFAKEDMPLDKESEDILSAIEELEKVDEETALKIADEKAKEISESAVKKKMLIED